MQHALSLLMAGQTSSGQQQPHLCFDNHLFLQYSVELRQMCHSIEDTLTQLQQQEQYKLLDDFDPLTQRHKFFISEDLSSNITLQARCAHAEEAKETEHGLDKEAFAPALYRYCISTVEPSLNMLFLCCVAWSTANCLCHTTFFAPALVAQITCIGE